MEKVDLEKNTAAESSPPPGFDKGGVETVSSGSKWTDFKDSFKRKEGVSQIPTGVPGEGPPQEALSRRLKSRHLQMIAIGGAIGTGLFVGSGSALANGGPGSLVIAFGLIGTMLYCTVHALGEMAVAYPVAGSFAQYSTRFIDPAWGFAMAWNYAMQWLIVFPLEIIAASITLSFWEGSRDINGAAWVTIFLGMPNRPPNPHWRIRS